jgi:two-component system chemotaxis response regulator CheY
MINHKENSFNSKIEQFSPDITFLVVEDLDNLRQQLIIDLRNAGVAGKIFEAANLQSDINICSTEKITFILSDWSLPDGTGNDLLKKIRTFEQYKKTPFIMCTNHGEINFFLEAVANGANDYIVKPWTFDELKKKLYLTWEVFLSKK